MKLPLRNSICNIEITTSDKPKTKNYDKTSLLVLLFTAFLAVGSIIYLLYQAQSQTEIHLTSNEFKKLVQEIFDETNDLINSGGVMIEVQVLDKNRNLLWFRPVDEESLKDEERAEKKIVDEFEEMKNEIMSEPSIRNIRNVDSSRIQAYVVSHQTQFVNCDHFKPISRGKYLVPPSLHALHTCYQYGVKMDELDRGILKRESGGEFRYNLPELYVACHDVFNDQMDELTSELKDDYERCKWSGALDESQQRIVEDRFASHFVLSNAPSNLEVSSLPYPPTTLPPPASTTTTTSSLTRLDPRAFVECSHVETELFEDSFESPSLEALQRCHKFGVTYDELRRGISSNPQLDQMRLDAGNLYISCQDVFDGILNYLTSELKDDYRRCKRMRVLSREIQAKVERKFYEALYDEREPTSKRPEYPSSTTEIVTTTSSSDDFERQTTTKAMNNIPPAFANCKRVENKDYYICIKVIATNNNSSNSSVINV